MIIPFVLDLKKLFILGTTFPWIRPDVCPSCKASHLWGHGYRYTWFDGHPTPLPLKRYYCPCCGCTITMRPATHFSRFQVSKQTIRSSISTRLITGKWPPWPFRRSQGRHWLRSLKRNSLAVFGMQPSEGFLEVFDMLVDKGLIPVTRSI